MAPLVIEGETLGEIHHKYNNLVNEAIKNNTFELTEINYDDSDFDNLFKIDIASNSRNIEYILQVLQSTDMLYVSRAIKKSTWLITDKQYAHVINPEYLFNELRLQMTSKAFNKLILQIRLLLRDEGRVEDFYNYYKEKDLQTALKWLSHCSQRFIANVLKKYANGNEITSDVLKRLCEKSSTVLVTYCRYNKEFNNKAALFQTMTNFVIHDDVNRYLDIIEAIPYYTPTFTAKYTKLIMTKCRNRIMKKLDTYADCMDVPTFAKFLSEEDIQYLILRNIKNRTLHSWLRDYKVVYLINRLPSDIRFEFMKKIFVDKDYKIDDDDSMLDDAVSHGRVQMRSGKRDNKTGTSQYTSILSKFAPFETVFTDLKNKIRYKSNPKDRIAILIVLLTVAGHNMQNIHTLLKYYREHHINEPFKFKIQFINIVLSKTKTYRYDKNTWNYLKDIFSSMEVFSKSDKNVQSCVKSVLLYCVINDETVPEIIEKKFDFETLKQYKKNLSQDERNKTFNYLLKSIDSKIQNNKLQNEKEFKVMIGILENALNLLCVWDKDLKDYPSILNKIKQIIEIKKENPAWEMDIRILYNKKKSWKKLLFAESLLVSPAQDTVMNALKHDAKLVETYQNKIVELLKSNINLDSFFKKIRIYWSASLAKLFKELLISNLNQSYNHEPIITGLCTLLPHKEITEIIKKYEPSETKIDWSRHDEVELYIHKFFAMNLYLARPQPSLDMALLYAKGDYLQYALPSLNAILHNMSATNVGKNLETLLNSPASLQKYGVRIAISKLKDRDVKRIFSDIWKSTSNTSVRALIFIHIHNMLYKEDNEQLIKETWEIIKMFIDTLTPDENNEIYIKLSQSDYAPMCIRGEYSMKTYEFFDALPAQANCNRSLILSNLIAQMPGTMLHLDDDFVVNIFMKSVDPKYTFKCFFSTQFVSTFLLSRMTEEAQMKRYNKMFVPMFTQAFSERPHIVPPNIREIIKSLYGHFDIVVSDNLVFPVKMFTEILENFQKSLPEIDNYIFLTFQKLGLKYITILDKKFRQEKEKDPEYFNESKTKYKIVDTIGPEFGRACAEQLKEDIAKKYMSIYGDFAVAFNTIFETCCYLEMTKLTALDAVIEDKEFVEGHLFALTAMPEKKLDDKEAALKNDILNKIGQHPNEDIKRLYSSSFFKFK